MVCFLLVENCCYAINMSVYMIIDSTVKDREKYEQYIDQVSPIVAKYGGCYHVRGGEIRSYGVWKPD